ncbi:hypothetical protein [Phenylobacterium sp.]|jgi:hypothetical protein|uniref:hypothetical protein n=1 Tax=Phenylobacterium sp. TaxID=1871053 RepID=UPI002F4289E1
MQVELTEERVFRIRSRISQEEAEGRAWARRTDAFGALSKMAGLLAKPKDEDFAVVYRERRLQPFWRCVATSVCAYQRTRTYPVKVAEAVRSVTVGGAALPVAGGQILVTGLEACREEGRREVFYDGLTKALKAELAAYLQYDSAEVAADELAAIAAEGVVLVPPEARASVVVRDVVAGAIGKIEADTVTEELVRVEAVELYYRPVYAFRYRRQEKEAVVEVDGLTGEAKTGGSTFEALMGKALDPIFLLDIGAEAVNMVIPGANLAKMVLVKGIEARRRK